MLKRTQSASGQRRRCRAHSTIYCGTIERLHFSSAESYGLFIGITNHDGGKAGGRDGGGGVHGSLLMLPNIDVVIIKLCVCPGKRNFNADPMKIRMGPGKDHNTLHCITVTTVFSTMLYSCQQLSYCRYVFVVHIKKHILLYVLLVRFSKSFYFDI